MAQELNAAYVRDFRQKLVQKINEAREAEALKEADALVEYFLILVDENPFITEMQVENLNPLSAEILASRGFGIINRDGKRCTLSI